MQRTNIYLEDRQTEALDRLAAEEGISRAELIRRLIDRGLAGAGDSLRDDLAVIDVSFAALIDVQVQDVSHARGGAEREAWLERLWQS